MSSLFPILLLLGSSISILSSCAEISRKELISKKSDVEPHTDLGHSIQSWRVNPAQVVQLSWQPRVFVYKGFISNEDCDHLTSLVQRKKDASPLNSSSEGLQGRSSSDTGDDIISRLEEKISAWIHLPKESSKPLQVLHYIHEEIGQKYDYFGNKSALEAGQPLIATVILHLSNVTQGGEIFFPESKELKSSRLKYKLWSYSSKNTDLLQPIKGNAVLFFHAHPNASPDKSSRHERHPVAEGEMWTATKHFYTRAVSKPRVQLESDNSECTDEDENCPKWAALGECKRNPVFMVGTPDYYGTCRKSCSVC